MLEIHASKLRQGYGGEFLEKAYKAGKGLVISRGSQNEGWDLELTAIPVPAEIEREKHITPRDLYANTIKGARKSIDGGVNLLLSKKLGVAFTMKAVENNAGRSRGLV